MTIALTWCRDTCVVQADALEMCAVVVRYTYELLAICLERTFGGSLHSEWHMLQRAHLSKILSKDAFAPEQAAVQALGRVANVTGVHQHLQRPLPLLLWPLLQIAAQLPHSACKVLQMSAWRCRRRI